MKARVALDDPTRFHELRTLIEGKGFLKEYYREIYRKYADCLARCPTSGIAVELGSGGGFAKQVVPEIVTSDAVPYAGVERVVDATAMPFPDGSVRAILMFNVFHHIPDVAAFLAEAQRCLVSGGRVLVVDQHPGWIGSPILRYAHHEPYDPDAREWRFESTGPLSGANGALAWIVFRRDRAKFERLFPTLQIERYAPHSPLRYWLSGGLKRWSLLPPWGFRAASRVDEWLVRLSPQFGSFVDIELVKVAS